MRSCPGAIRVEAGRAERFSGGAASLAEISRLDLHCRVLALLGRHRWASNQDGVSGSDNASEGDHTPNNICVAIREIVEKVSLPSSAFGSNDQPGGTSTRSRKRPSKSALPLY